MKKIKPFVIIFILLLLGYLVYKVVVMIEQKREISAVLKELPDFSFKTLSEESFPQDSLNVNYPTVFIYFNSTCDFCQHEAQSISENIDLFEGVNLLFVSAEEMILIKKFGVRYDLVGKSDVHFLQDSQDIFSERFGATSFPYLLIYDENHKLIQKYKGQLKAMKIVEILRNQ